MCLIYWKYCNFLKDDFITLCKDDSVDVLDGILPNLYSIMEIFTHNDIFKPDSHVTIVFISIVLSLFSLQEKQPQHKSKL